MYAGRVIIGCFTAVLLCRFMPPCSKGLAGPYMWLDITGHLVVSEKLRINRYRIYVLELYVPGQ